MKVTSAQFNLLLEIISISLKATGVFAKDSKESEATSKSEIARLLQGQVLLQDLNLFGFLAIILMLFISTPFAYGASFDCSSAATKVERLVCSDPQLSEMDSKLDISYRKARESEKLVNNKDKLREQQIIWLHDIRDRCLDSKCLRVVYEQRISQLKAPQAPDNCAVADQGILAAVATCSGRELQMEEQYLDNLIKVLTFTKSLTDTQILNLQKMQADWEKNRECHCWGKADGYSSGTRAAIVIGCKLEEVKMRIAEIKQILQGAPLDFGGNSPPLSACK